MLRKIILIYPKTKTKSHFFIYLPQQYLIGVQTPENVSISASKQQAHAIWKCLLTYLESVLLPLPHEQ
jgi:hypothetical protein